MARKENIPPTGSDSNIQVKGRRLCRAYKTQVCTSFTLTNSCKYGDMCCFAHGLDELRQRPNPPKYKTTMCRNIIKFGHCPYGSKCDFIHAYDNDGRPLTRKNPSRCPKQQLFIEPKSESKELLSPLGFNTSYATVPSFPESTVDGPRDALTFYTTPILSAHKPLSLKRNTSPGLKDIIFSQPRTTNSLDSRDTLVELFGNHSCNRLGFGFDEIRPCHAYTKDRSIPLMQTLDQQRMAGGFNQPFTVRTSQSRNAYSFSSRESGFYGVLATVEETGRSSRI